MPLSTGDFEAVSYPESPMPPPPRLPQLNRAPAPAAGLPAHYAPPAAPNSLSPVAMAMARDAVATGPQRAQSYVIATRPSIRTGLSILFAGALIGGIVGITMRARQNAADAAFAAQQMQIAANSPPPAAAPIEPPSAQPVGSSSDSSLLGGPLPGSTIIIPPSAAVAVGAKGAKESKKPVAHGGGRSFAGPRVSAPSRPSSKKDKDSDDGWTVASAGNTSDTKESAPASREPKERDVTVREAPPPEKPKASRRSRGGSSDDADAVLKAAMGATENTL